MPRSICRPESSARHGMYSEATALAVAIALSGVPAEAVKVRMLLVEEALTEVAFWMSRAVPSLPRLACAVWA